MSTYHNDIMVVSGKKEFTEIKKTLEKIGFHKLYIFPARSQKDALCEIALIRDAGRDIEILLFDYRDPQTELETIMAMKRLEAGSAANIAKIVILDPEKIKFVKNSKQFKKSEIVFIAFDELKTTIEKIVRREN